MFSKITSSNSREFNVPSCDLNLALILEFSLAEVKTESITGFMVEPIPEKLTSFDLPDWFTYWHESQPCRLNAEYDLICSKLDRELGKNAWLIKSTDYGEPGRGVPELGFKEITNCLTVTFCYL